MTGHTPSRESKCNICLKTNHNGTLRIQEVTEVSAKLCKSAWDAVRQQSSIVRCFFYGSKIRNHIVDAASISSMQPLFRVTARITRNWFLQWDLLGFHGI